MRHSILNETSATAEQEGTLELPSQSNEPNDFLIHSNRSFMKVGIALKRTALIAVALMSSETPFKFSPIKSTPQKKKKESKSSEIGKANVAPVIN